MSNFNFYKSKEVYREKYYQMPMVFFTNDKYKPLSNDAKIAYMLLKDRFDYSVKNNWVDDDDNIYFIFTAVELMNFLNCREGKLSKIKKELEQVGLLHQKKGRIKSANGKIESTPNKLYLGKPEVTSQDVFRINEIDKLNGNPVDAKIAVTQKDHQISKNPVNAKIAVTQKVSNINSFSVDAKIANNLYYNNLDTNRHLIDTGTDSVQNQLLLDGFVDLMKDSSINTFIPDRCLNLIARFSGTFEEAKLTVKTIHNAKYKAEQETGESMVYEFAQEKWDVDTKLYTTLLKAYQKQKTEKVNNLQNLVFIYVKNLFIEHVQPSLSKKTDNLPPISTGNWLD